MQSYVRPFLGARYQQHPWGPPGPLRWYPPGWSGEPVVFAPSWSEPSVQTLPPAGLTPQQVQAVLISAQQWLLGKRLGSPMFGGICPAQIEAVYPGFQVTVHVIGPPLGLRRIPEVYMGNRLRLLVNGNGVVIRVSLG